MNSKTPPHPPGQSSTNQHPDSKAPAACIPAIADKARCPRSPRGSPQHTTPKGPPPLLPAKAALLTVSRPARRPLVLPPYPEVQELRTQVPLLPPPPPTSSYPDGQTHPEGQIRGSFSQKTRSAQAIMMSLRKDYPSQGGPLPSVHTPPLPYTPNGRSTPPNLPRTQHEARVTLQSESFTRYQQYPRSVPLVGDSQSHSVPLIGDPQATYHEAPDKQLPLSGTPPPEPPCHRTLLTSSPSVIVPAATVTRRPSAEPALATGSTPAANPTPLPASSSFPTHCSTTQAHPTQRQPQDDTPPQRQPAAPRSHHPTVIPEPHPRNQRPAPAQPPTGTTHHTPTNQSTIPSRKQPTTQSIHDTRSPPRNQTTTKQRHPPAQQAPPTPSPAPTPTPEDEPHLTSRAATSTHCRRPPPKPISTPPHVAEPTPHPVQQRPPPPPFSHFLRSAFTTTPPPAKDAHDDENHRRTQPASGSLPPRHREENASDDARPKRNDHLHQRPPAAQPEHRPTTADASSNTTLACPSPPTIRYYTNTPHPKPAARSTHQQHQAPPTLYPSKRRSAVPFQK
ncbi:hypothetical protein BDK51DRAFT_50071 [Blyttiomyces helicus]|uniref:Uncharacterized protein n=1 Tax=Blyttiomyces helicus TaxID=388810 RepID=A0A4P9WKK1_9FUNG|nr:hypothetical protein BDK51DRAFT_50071 [Blyttiomyces helicus]|eukprot:RKO93511.1 hypothetical protein BDK51DRAFT_50071 [Blyttiomyces helicus]